jgi:hypothetical protein
MGASRYSGPGGHSHHQGNGQDRRKKKAHHLTVLRSEALHQGFGGSRGGVHNRPVPMLRRLELKGADRAQQTKEWAAVRTGGLAPIGRRTFAGDGASAPGPSPAGNPCQCRCLSSSLPQPSVLVDLAAPQVCGAEAGSATLW